MENQGNVMLHTGLSVVFGAMAAAAGGLDAILWTSSYAPDAFHYALQTIAVGSLICSAGTGLRAWKEDDLTL